MTKIVYNACYGGYSLSHEAMMLYCEKKGINVYPEKHSLFCIYWTVPENERDDSRHDQRIYEGDIDRTDPVLVEVVEELGKKANGICADLQIEDVPKGTLYRITEYDGYETVETREEIEWRVA